MGLSAATSRSRLLKLKDSMEALLPDDYFDGNVLSCQVKEANGEVSTEYFCSETGKTYSEDQHIEKMVTYADRFYIERMDAQVQQRIFGSRSGERQSFLLETAEDAVLTPVLELNGIVSCLEQEDGLVLSFYNLTTGLHTAQATLPGVHTMQAIQCNGAYIWILALEGEKQVLLRWDINLSSVEDENIYIGKFYTPDEPDKDGLQECKKLADTYESTYKVELYIGTDEMKDTGGYTVVAEHQPQMVRTSLENLQPVLEQLQPIFSSLANSGKKVQIGLVRSIDGGEQWVRFQYNKTWWFLICSEADMSDAVFDGMTIPIESHVIGNSRDYELDRWNPLNPAEFIYINGGEIEPDLRYLEGENRAFVNVEAMNSISEDRRSIIYNAMLPDNAEMFSAPIMQAKLNRICMGIREACGLQKSEKTYIWEQYLTDSLAYVKS